MRISKLNLEDMTYDTVRKLCITRQYVADNARTKIIGYLKKRAFVDAASSAHVYDVFDNSLSDDYCSVAYTDGTYEWSSEEIFYFEKYNLILDNEFIQYVLEKAG